VEAGGRFPIAGGGEARWGVGCPGCVRVGGGGSRMGFRGEAILKSGKGWTDIQKNPGQNNFIGTIGGLQGRGGGCSKKKRVGKFG